MRLRKPDKSAFTWVAALLMAATSVGCSQSDKQRWNEFWGVDSKPRRRTVRTAPANSQQASNDRPNEAKPSPAEDVKPESNAPTGDNPPESTAQGAVDSDVDDYVARMNPPPKSDYEPNDHMSKIQRQQDPNRHKRIESAAHQEGGEGQTSPESGDATAMNRYERNTGVAVETADESEKNASSGEDATPTQKPEDGAKSSPVVRTASAGDRAKTVPEVTPAGEGDGNRPTPASTEAQESSEVTPVRHMEANTSRKEVEPADDRKTGQTPENPSAIPEAAEISITAGPKPAEAGADGSNAENTIAANAPAETESEGDSLRNRIGSQEKIVERDPNNLEEQYKLRMMYLIDGQDDKAKAIIPGVDSDIQDIISAQIDSLISARSTSGRDAALWATRQLESLEELRRLVKQRADLVIPKVALCTVVEGYGRYKPVEPTKFKVSKPHRVLIYIEVDNFTSKTTNSGMYRTLLTVRESLLTKAGKEIWSQKYENIEDLSRRPRRDFYLTTETITIPKELPTGEYLLKIEVEDVFAAKMNSNVVKFEIVE